jgi:hypothetical protein
LTERVGAYVMFALFACTFELFTPKRLRPVDAAVAARLDVALVAARCAKRASGRAIRQSHLQPTPARRSS